MLPILFFYAVAEIPGDLVKSVHRLVRGNAFVPANRWVYRFAGMLLVCAALVVGLALTSEG